MKSLIVALDETADATSAMNWGITVARAQRSSIVGVCPLDTEMGAEEDFARLSAAQDRNARLARTFLDACRAQELAGGIVIGGRDPATALAEIALEHDAIVVGGNSDFGGEEVDGLSLPVARLLRRSPRPVIVIRAGAGPPTRIIVAYDGSLAAAKALQLFAMTGLAREADVCIVSINQDHRTAERQAKQAAQYLRLYGVLGITRPIGSATNAADLIAQCVTEQQAQLLVMGCFGRSGWRELLIGSTTSSILAAFPTSLFIHH